MNEIFPLNYKPEVIHNHQRNQFNNIISETYDDYEKMSRILKIKTCFPLINEINWKLRSSAIHVFEI